MELRQDNNNVLCFYSGARPRFSIAYSAKFRCVLGSVALCAGVSIGTIAHAQSQAECIAPKAQQLMNSCAAKEYRQADEALNSAWKSAKSFAVAIGQRQALLNAQRAWLTYRDAACAVHASPYEGGSLQPYIRATCLSEITAARTRMLLDFNAY